MLNVSSRHLQISMAKKSLDSKWVTRRGGNPAWANFDYASALNEFIMLGNVATQVEDKLGELKVYGTFLDEL
jgi:hypothetical protein